MTMKLLRVPSPNWGHRPAGTVIDCVVLHATASDDVEQDVAWCRDKQSKVSYHAIVDRWGTVYDLVSVEHRAWHAGVSSFVARPNVNDYSIGLSFANKNDGIEKYSDEQYDVGAALVAGYMRAYPAITLERITTHRAIALPAGRKTDPLGFDMQRFKDLVQTELAQT